MSDIPFSFHEIILTGMERKTVRLWRLALVLFAAFMGSNIYWFFRVF